MGNGRPPRGSLGGASCRLLRELNRWSLVRGLMGDLSVWLFGGNSIEATGRRSQKGLAGLLLAMNCSVSTLKNSAVPDVSSSSGKGAVAGSGSRSGSLCRSSSVGPAALDVSGEATCDRLDLLFSCSPARSLIPLLCPSGLFSASFVHGFRHSLVKGPLRRAVRMSGGFPRRYCNAIASTLLRLAAMSFASWLSTAVSSTRSLGWTGEASKSSPRLR